MRVERLLLRYSDGQSEWRMPAEVPEIGTTVTRAGQQWIVAAVEDDGEDVTVAVLRRAPKPDKRRAPDEAVVVQP
jgi:hypothetical protein